MFRLLVICFFTPLLMLAQPAQHKYFLRFKDKNGSTFSVSDPSAFLSARAIARRSAQNIPIITGDLPVNSNYINSVNSMGATVLTRSKWFNGLTIECDSSVLTSVLSLPFVVSATRIFIQTNSGQSKQLYEDFPLKLNSPLRILNYDYGGSFNQIHMMNGEFLHEEGFTGDGMLIALLDAGFYSVNQLPAFDSLRNQNHIIATWDFVSGDSSVYEDDSHGMSVLSTIAGNVPGQLIGTAPNASFLLLRTEDVNSENIIEEYNWEAGAEFADSAGADVISSSLGYTEFDDPLTNHVYSDMDGNHCPSSIAADLAVSKGILVLTSAGNSGNNPWHYISAPSDGDSVLSIGAVNSNGNHVSFSSWGPASDGDVKPNLASQGLNCTLADAGGGVSTGSGTSFACPILAGAATCLWQAFPALTAMQIKSAIERSANYYFAPNDTVGYGIPDFRLASYILSTGNGLLPAKDDIIGVYPNPFSENLNVRFFSTTSQTVKLEMINAIGQIISSRNENALARSVNTYTISNDNNLKNGFYFIRVSTAEGNIVNKVLKY